MSELFNVEAEQAIIGALLLENDALARIPTLEPKHFFDGVHGQLFDMIRATVTAGDLASPVTIKHRVGDLLKDVGGPGYLARMAGSASVSSLTHVTKAVIDLWARRDMVEALDQARERISAPDGGAVSAIAVDLESRVAKNLASGGGKPMSSSMSKAVMDAVEEINTAYQGDAPVGVSSGMTALDDLIGTLRPGRVYIAAGRPSMGKTALAWNVANKVAATGAGVLFYTGEMPERDMAKRGLSQILRERGVKVPYFAMERGQLSEGDFRAVLDVAKEQGDRNIRFIGSEYREAAALALAIRSTARMMRNPGLIVVDYLQLMQLAGARTAFDRVGGASKMIKQIAMDLRLPVLLLSQLSREVESRDDKRPVLSDLRQSGEIEEDADTVMFTYRPEYYLNRQQEPKNPGLAADWHAERAAAANLLEIIVAKNRAGPIGTAKVRIEIQHNFIEDMPMQERMEV